MSGKRKRKSETTFSAAQGEKKPKDSGTTSTNTMTLQAGEGQPSDQQGGHLWGFAKLAALNGKQVLVSAAHAESDTKGENLKSDIENFESMMHNSNSENEDWEGFIQESYGENFSQNQPQSEEVSAMEPAKKRMKMTYDSNLDFDAIVVKTLQQIDKAKNPKKSDKTDAKYICEECQKEGCRLYCIGIGMELEYKLRCLLRSVEM